MPALLDLPTTTLEDSMATQQGPGQQEVGKLLPPGVLQGLEDLTGHEYWMQVMKQADIAVSNEDLFRYRFVDIQQEGIGARLAFLAGSGEFGGFNAKYLINQVVEQCAEMQMYTKKLEKYCVKLQQKLEQVQAKAPAAAVQPVPSGDRKRERSPSHDGDGDDSSARM